MIINSRFNGPPNSGNGGYVGGLMAKQLGDTVEVTLLKPPPLNQELSMAWSENTMELSHQNRLIAKAVNATMDLQPPVIPSMADAVLCETRYPGYQKHVFPECFVCGPARGENDGLRLFTGLSGSKDYVAAPFRTFKDLYDDEGFMLTEFIWSALDCPGAYAITQIDTEKHLVLGRMTVAVNDAIHIDEKLIVMGWYEGSEGKKNYSGTAIINSDGVVKAVGDAIWIEIDPAKFISERP